MPMTLEDFNLAYLSVVIFMAVIAIAGSTLLLLGILIRPKKVGNMRKYAPYESGVPPTGRARERYSVRFYIIAMLFVLFDIEIVFLYPWAINFDGFVRRGDGFYALIIMAIFLFILLLGYADAWRKGALNWVS
jgi:NADH-quinone oxidoreductase subunit A